VNVWVLIDNNTKKLTGLTGLLSNCRFKASPALAATNQIDR